MLAEQHGQRCERISGEGAVKERQAAERPAKLGDGLISTQNNGAKSLTAGKPRADRARFAAEVDTSELAHTCCATVVPQSTPSEEDYRPLRAVHG